MKLLVVFLTCSFVLVAQQTKKKETKFEFCGHGSSHECICIRHTQAVQDAYLASCSLNSKSEKELHDCAAAMPGHCSIVEQSEIVDDEQGEGQPAMSDRCTMMCKKHDCLCDDGPACHIGHSARDHNDHKDQ